MKAIAIVLMTERILLLGVVIQVDSLKERQFISHQNRDIYCLFIPLFDSTSILNYVYSFMILIILHVFNLIVN